MKKYNLKKIMARAWEIKRQDYKNVFSLCLKMAWEENKKVKFINNMEVVALGYHRYLVRWTKNGMDRVYIKNSGKKDEGYVDLKNKKSYLRGNLTYQEEIARMILEMEFDTVNNNVEPIFLSVTNARSADASGKLVTLNDKICVELSGGTYDCKEELKEAGFRFDGKAWYKIVDKADHISFVNALIVKYNLKSSNAVYSVK